MEAPSNRAKGKRGSACMRPSAIAIKLGKLGPRSLVISLNNPTNTPPSSGPNTTGQLLNQGGGIGIGGNTGSGGSATGGDKTPKPPRPICNKDCNGVEVAAGGGGGSTSGNIGCGPTASITKATKGP